MNNDNNEDGLKQLVLYLVKESCRSNVLLQFMMNEIAQMNDLKDLLYSEVLYIQIDYVKKCNDLARIKVLYASMENLNNANKNTLGPKKNSEGNIDSHIKKLNISILELNDQISVFFFGK